MVLLNRIITDIRNLKWRGGRVVEGARLESVYTPKGYRGFESLPLRKKSRSNAVGIFFYLFNI